MAIAQALALALGSIAATIALYGRYRTLPGFLTGPHVCRLPAAGCQVLFRTREASLLGIPNAIFGIALYVFVLVGLLAGWPTGWLFVGATPGLAMSVYLARYLLRNHLECRVCWAGHLANLMLWVSLLSGLTEMLPS